VSRRATSRRVRDALFVGALRASALLAAAIVLFIIVFIVREALPALSEFGLGRFFSDPTWHPTSGTFDLSPMIIGSLVVTLGSTLVSVPMGLIAAVFLRFHAPHRVRGAFRAAIALLAGIPSVVYGLWGLVVLVPLIARLAPPGTSGLAAIAVLSVMTFPTVALGADAAIRGVRPELLLGGLALGMSRGAVIRGIVLPAAAPGLTTAAFLQTARAIGETMAVLMVAGNVVRMPKSLLDPMRTLTANIALEMGYAAPLHRSALFVSALILIGLVVAIVLIADSRASRSRDGG
jgi:phosphate transport system permease protein